MPQALSLLTLIFIVNLRWGLNEMIVVLIYQQQVGFSDH